MSLLPAACLVAGGCLKQETFDPNVSKPSAIYTSTAKHPAEDGPKRQPKAETCSSYGAAAEQAADGSKDPSAKASAYRQARIAYEQSLSIDAKNRLAMLGIARIASKEGNPQKAVDLFTAALKVYPQDAELWHELGMCWGKQKQFDQAIPCLAKAVTLDPKNPTYSNNYGWTLARAGYYQESFDHFSRTVGEAQANYKLALMSMHLGNPELCRQYVTAALQVDPQFPAAQQLLAQLNGTADAPVKTAAVDAPR
jgi:Tfp pilus assembly protein PilF